MKSNQDVYKTEIVLLRRKFITFQKVIFTTTTRTFKAVYFAINKLYNGSIGPALHMVPSDQGTARTLPEGHAMREGSVSKDLWVPAVERGSLQTGYTHQRVRHTRAAGTSLLLGAERLRILTA